MAESVDLEIVKVDGHPQHGDFEVEVPKTYSDEDIRKYVKGLDLDLMLGLPQEKAAEVAQPDGETDLNMIKDFENKTNTGLRDGKWFIHDVDSPYMSIALSFKEGMSEKVPAVVHFDGTARLQSVDKKDNEWYYTFIKKFKEKTGIPMLLNTSFNDREPIVETPEHAMNCFMRTNIDYLYFRDYGILVSKK